LLQDLHLRRHVKIDQDVATENYVKTANSKHGVKQVQFLKPHHLAKRSHDAQMAPICSKYLPRYATGSPRPKPTLHRSDQSGNAAHAAHSGNGSRRSTCSTSRMSAHKPITTDSCDSSSFPTDTKIFETMRESRFTQTSHRVAIDMKRPGPSYTVRAFFDRRRNFLLAIRTAGSLPGSRRRLVAAGSRKAHRAHHN